ncbi:MAG: FAD:protein FMN transferase [Thiohalocapsa sp.]|uniref:FAD:protein FMN transferase n=1 Tax=Thiohalocapsa sp. TaxID=2497641 RepID=UPI0025EA1A62|nr:FAD:protein FMN transferase [Thiohalocapsa sp.]MCG6943328.1 FAD:protein FMN transferase [Thiohalocapsa sp.]
MLFLLLAGCGPREQTLALAGSTMGTTWSVQVPHPAADLDQAKLYEDISAVLEEVNGRMSTYQPSSELSRFNTATTTDWFPVSAELERLVATALAVSKATGGAFDVTVGPLVNLWGFGPEVHPDEIPPQADIDAARARVGWHRLHTRAAPPALRKDRPDLYVDLSAIAKGHGVDRVAELLEGKGLTDYLVEIGGELRGRGVNAQGEPWRIAIERPDPGRRAALRVVALTDQAMATSGDYRNFFEVNGKRYSHTIDPATGRPVVHDLASVTVVAERCGDADAWATSLLVLGPQKGMALANKRGLATLFVERLAPKGKEEELRITESAAFAQAAGEQQ